MSNISSGILIALLLLSAAGANARQGALGMPSMKITGDDGKEWQLAVRNVKVDVAVAGNFATTTLDMTFHNKANRVLEGELNFPLPEGQTVSRFAMDVNGKMREGAVVEKDKGRVVFEEIVRRGVDPGLMEMTEGNVFRTRVYPIPSRGTKRIIVAYCEEIKSDSLGMVYRLPLDFPDELDNFELNAVVYGDLKKPRILSENYSEMKFEKDGNSFVAGVEYNNFDASTQFEMMLPEPETGRNTFVEKFGNKSYFLINCKIPVMSMYKTLPGKIGILYDCSSSGIYRDKEKEQALLDQYFSRIGNCSVEFISYNIYPKNPVTFYVYNGDWSSLKSYIDNMAYDGGTSMGCLNLNDYNCDEFLLFSDGMSNFGEKKIELCGKPVYPVNSSQSANHSYLSYISFKSGGQYLNLMNTDKNTAAEILTAQPYKFISAYYHNTEITDVCTPINNTGRSISVAGVLLNSSTEIELNFGYGNLITHTEKISINASEHESESGIIPRIWAQKKIAFLDMDFEANKDEITALGKEFSIVTRNTSLIVLETLQDYLRYRIEPPEEFREQYLAQIKSLTETKKTDSLQVLNRVRSDFNSIKEWWLMSINNQKVNWNKQTQPVQNNSDTIVNYNLPPVSKFSYSIPKNETVKIGIYGGLKGRVLDESGEPLIGANVIIMGTNLGAYTNAEGRYGIAKIIPGYYLVKFSYAGYREQIIEVETEKNIFKQIGDIKLGGAVTDTICVMQTRVESRVIGSVTSTRTQDLKLPVNGINGIVSLSSGVRGSGKGFSIRGSRTSETQIRVDGLDEGNQFTGGFGIAGRNQFPMVSTYANEPVRVIKGGFTAEYAVVLGMDTVPDLSGKGINKIGVSFGENKTKISEFYSQPEYLKELYDATDEEKPAAYLKLKSKYGYSAAFYLDAADYFFRNGFIEDALVIASNLAELKTEEAQLLRTLGYRLYNYGYYKFAEYIFREVLRIRNEEPQSYRDLALACIETGLYQEAADLLYKVLTGQFDGRFSGIGDVVINEFNNLLLKHSYMINMKNYDFSLIGSMPAGIRVVLSWDTDNCDMDLWVTEPDGTRCYYAHSRTKNGGKMTRDFTGGYGPEEYMMKVPMQGKYVVQANYFGSRQQKTFNPINLKASIYLNYGTDIETRKDITFRLGRESELVNIAEIVFE